MNADRLREAARVLRERATDATTGPWTVSGDGWICAEVESCTCYGGDPPYGHEPGCGLDPIGSATSPDAAYIAMMHPPVALALADWLDLAADDHDAGCPSDCPATRVADAILGGDR